MTIYRPHYPSEAALRHVTGGEYARYVASLLSWAPARRWSGIRLVDGFRFDSSIAAGGPIDAPSFIPAGSCNSTGSLNWRGRTVGTISMTWREAPIAPALPTPAAR